jgi:antitoxin MazE
MRTKIQRWGNSQGVRLSRETLASAGIAVGDAVDITVESGIVRIASAKRVPGGVDLASLLAAIPDDYTPEEVDWGPPRGREVW